MKYLEYFLLYTTMKCRVYIFPAPGIHGCLYSALNCWSPVLVIFSVQVRIPPPPTAGPRVEKRLLSDCWYESLITEIPELIVGIHPNPVDGFVSSWTNTTWPLDTVNVLPLSSAVNIRVMEVG
jgi:hypothetical protein